MQDEKQTSDTSVGGVPKEIGGHVRTSLVCLAVVGAALWGWQQMTSGNAFSFNAGTSSSYAMGSDLVSIDIGVSRMSEGNRGCEVGFSIANTGRSLAAQISTQIEARAQDGSAIGAAVILGSNIRAGGEGIDKAKFSNVACNEIASIFVAPRRGYDFGASAKTLVPLEM